MPADRSKSIKRAEDNFLTWTVPVEPTSACAGGSAFISTFSSTLSDDFDDGPPPLVDQDTVLFPPTDASARARKPAHSKKKAEDHIPRPPNAFILFRSSFIKGQHVSTEVETNHSTLSKIIGLTWKNLPDDERKFWHAKAKVALDEHKRKFPQYTFRPTHGKSKGVSEKRKVREVGPKDPVRCAKIAELLVQGKKGQELDAAIQEFDKHHVPQVVTRFDQPITARSYRRSSSVPAPEVLAKSTSSSKTQKPRATSTQPSSPVDPSPSFSELPMPQTPSEASYSSFDHYSSPVTPSDSFIDFSTFSFNQSSYGASIPLSPESICPSDASNALFNYPQSSYGHSPVELTVDTSYLSMNDWNCPSPASVDSPAPATPSSCMSSPMPDAAFSQYAFDALQASLAKAYNASFTGYPESCGAQYNTPFHTEAPAAAYPSFEQDCGKVHMVGQDLDFSALMSSIPGYAL